MILCHCCSCDLLEKSYLCGIQNNVVETVGNEIYVVICLKNRTFAVYKTTRFAVIVVGDVLWFAWKIVPLRYTKQPYGGVHTYLSCCDLLEKSYLCGIQNNSSIYQSNRSMVVICLKNRTFAVYKTTSWRRLRTPSMLWFAWKIVPLRYTKQRPIDHVRLIVVVICLKNRTFAVYKTTDLM